MIIKEKKFSLKVSKCNFTSWTSGNEIIDNLIQEIQLNIKSYIEIGKLIGRKGRNIKPIEKETGTCIYINTEVNPRQIEIKINKDYKYRDENISHWEWINKAIC